MVSRVPVEMFYRDIAEPGSIAKEWNKEELIRCRATGTKTSTNPNLKGQAHPVFSNWIGAKPDLYKELEQPILLASKILEAAGLPWLSDFLADDIFSEEYPGRERFVYSESTSASEESVTFCSIVRHHQAPWATPKQQTQWRRLARDNLRNEFPKLIQWQIDEDMFRQKDWNGYTCCHPRGELPLSELNKYETIEKFDSISPHEGSRDLTILVMAEYPARLAELRRQGKAGGEEYLLTAFMTTVTMLHELGHVAYWKHRRALTWDMREPFYGADLEIELGDSFIAAIFGGWIPVPVRQHSRLRDDFSFADGIAWRQILTWDHHRMRPKYRAHYSIPVDYVARLFTEANWSTTSQTVTTLIRPQFLTGNSFALRTVDLYTPLAQANRHATAAIDDFHCEGDGCVWKRRPSAWFRIPQYNGWFDPELELSTAPEDAICEPVAREHGRTAATRYRTPPNSLCVVEGSLKEGKLVETIVKRTVVEGAETTTQEGKQERSGDALSLSLVSLPISNATTAAATTTMSPSPRKSEYSRLKSAHVTTATKIPRPIPSGSPVPRCGMGPSKPRKRVGQLEREEQSSSLTQIREQREHQDVKHQHIGKLPLLRRIQHDKEGENIQYSRFNGGWRGNDSNSVGSHDRGEISVEELKKRLSQLIGVSLTELERLFDGPPCKSAGVE